DSTSNGSASTLTTGTGTENNTSRSNTPTLSNQVGRALKKGKSRGKRKRWSMNNKNNKNYSNNKYNYSCMAREDHGQPIFGVQFHQKLKPGQPLILATVGSNRVSIYECIPEGSLKILQVYADPDADENFYTCAWTDDWKGEPLLAAAGARGVIRIFAPTEAACVKHYLGHGHAINDLLFHPKDPNLLLSASKDHSLRLWNIKTDYCVAIFGGVEGHRDEVLAADVDIDGTRIVSCGMDHSLKVWKLNKPEIELAIQSSYTWTTKTIRNGVIHGYKPFPTIIQNFPEYSTRDVHRNYVDCAKWFGEFILSKSCENTIVCWKGGKTFQKWDEITPNTTETTVIHRFEIKDCEIWFIRFCLDFHKKTLALGNQSGKTYIYDMTAKEPNQIKSTVLSHPKCISAIRQTAMSRDGTAGYFLGEDKLIYKVILQASVTIAKPCKRGCDNDIDTWTQSVKEAEDSVYGDDSYICHSCVNNCVREKMGDKFGSDFNVYKADCDQKNAYYVWYFGTAMVHCMEEIGPSKCKQQMKFSCGYDFKNMLKSSGSDSCNWKENCKKWGFDNAKFQPEDANWEPYTDKK
ncbi:unnamed protein product, partial [Allacma fusca]